MNEQKKNIKTAAASQQRMIYPSADRYLPTSVKEMKALGWDHVDVVIFSGDAYVDHPSFGAAVIGRTLQAAGYNVALVPQPNWQDDLRDFRKFGAPRLFFGVSAGAMDSMVNHRRPPQTQRRRIYSRRTPRCPPRLSDHSLLGNPPRPLPRHPHNSRRHRGVDAPAFTL